MLWKQVFAGDFFALHLHHNQRDNMQYRQLEGNIGELKFYGNISEWWISGEDFTRTLQEMEGKFPTIHVRVHCYGGSVFEGVVMQSALKRCKSKVIFYIDGVAASMITQVMLDADTIIISENAFVMVHCPTGYTVGNAKVHAQTTKLLVGMEKNFGRNYARKTGKSEKDVQKWFDGTDYWFSADEAKDEGLVDTIDAAVVDAVEMDKPTDNGQSEQVFNRFAALLSDPTNQIINQENSKMKKELIAQFGLTGVTENSSDAEIQAALKSHFDNSAKNSGTETIKKAVEAIIASVEKVHGKTYEATLRANLVAVGEGSGLEVLQSMLGLNAPSVDAAAAPGAAASPAATTVVPKVISLMTGGGAAVAEDRKSWDWDKWQDEDQAGLEDLEKDDPEAFGAIYFKEFGRKP